MTEWMDGSTNISEDLLEGESTVEQIQPLLNTLARKIEAVPIPVLAYVGDAVFEVFARLHSMYTNEWNMNTLHRASVRLVKAESQAELLRLLEPYLSEEEKNMVRRGRNAKSGQIPKGVSAPLYRYSTAFETLMGYLYLTDRSSRIEELLKLAGLSRSRV